MALSRPNSQKIFDPIRGRLVAKTPEEAVRQRLIQYMIQECGFPKSLIGVEKGLTDRRIDLICFARDLHPENPLHPLVLAECKKDTLTEEAVSQAFGYNAQIKAPFILLASPKELRLYFPSALGMEFVPYLLPYQELIQKAKTLYV